MTNEAYNKAIDTMSDIFRGLSVAGLVYWAFGRKQYELTNAEEAAAFIISAVCFFVATLIHKYRRPIVRDE